MIDYNDFNWLSDWIGHEVGFDDVDAVGLYTFKKYPNVSVYIDVIKGVVLEAWCDSENE